MFDNINLKDYEIISFDIFDTLIVRYVEKPIDIFAIIEDKAEHAKKFKVNRINAEIHARKKYAREIKLDDIYTELTDIYDDDLIKRLKSMEIALEGDFCIKRQDVYNFFKICQNNHKRIIITSDMYLPKEVVEDILNKNDILNYEHLYLSSEVGERKKDGKLFQHIIKDLNVEPSKILHIGDNKNSDYNEPNKLGIKSFLIEKVKVNDNKNFLLKDSIYSKIINIL